MRILLFALYFTLTFTSYCQTDTVFWFAAPEVTSDHADRPVYLRICSFDKQAEVKITQPANSQFATITRTVKTNSTVTIDLTTRLALLENDIPDAVKNSGLLIETTAPVTVYYEVLGNSLVYGDVNTDIFTLKGRYSLGTEFFTPFQNARNNQASIDAYSGFDIVATEDNTQITITPTKDLVGHQSGIAYTVTLHRGQVYSARTVSEAGTEHPSGTRITSTKPIAVTVKDDSVLEETNWDLLGDQLVPVEQIGTEYIVGRLSLPAYNSDRIYIVATEDTTIIYQDALLIPVDTIHTGETSSLQFQDNVCYIRTNKPVYLWHVGGFGNELAGALLPEISCTGSRKVRFTRSNSESFALNIIVKTSGVNNFLLNGKGLPGTPNVFTEVPGTSGEWSFAQIFFSQIALKPGSSNLLENSSNDFHLGILNGEATGTSFRYGYFSSFGYSGMTGDSEICPGETAILDAGEAMSSYLWNTGETKPSISVKDSGTYSVRVIKGKCEFTDSIKVKLHPTPAPVELGPDISICSYEQVTFQPDKTYHSYLWNTGATDKNITPSLSGMYLLEVANEFGCKASDSIKLTINQKPHAIITLQKPEEVLCQDAIVVLTSNQGNFKYLWHNGDTTESTTDVHEKLYSIKITDEYGCSDSTSYYIDCSPYVKVFNLMTPNGDNKNDVFYVQDLKPGKWTLEIYTKWGSRVYKNSNYDNSWKAENLEDGVYFYLLKHNEGKRVLHGYVTILN